MHVEGCPTWPSEFADFYRQQNCWRGETFAEMLKSRAIQYGDKTVITSNTGEISYAHLQERVEQLAAGFQQVGMEKGDRVVVQLPNEVAFFEVIFALFNIGALPVFALPSHRYSEVRHFCEFSEAKALIIPDTYAGFDYLSMAELVKKEVRTLKHVIVEGDAEQFVPLLKLYKDTPFVPSTIHPSDVAFLQLSGGSTGLSKLIPRTHDDYIYSLRRSNEVCALTEESVYLAVLPIAHNFPLSSPGVLGTIYAGGRIVLSSGPSPDQAFSLIEKERVTFTAMVPPIAIMWTEAVKNRHDDLSSLEVIQVGGAKFSAESAKRIQPAFGCKLQQVFGMAEGLVNYTRFDDPEEIIVHTQGRPMSPYDEIRVVDEDDQDVPPGEVGELLTRGPYTIRGYYKADEHNAKSFTDDGFYRTGDLVRLNKEGYIIVEGRDKDQINRGGEKIAAEEVENHLLAHPSVFDAAVVSMPDPYLGERSCAFIIPKGEHQASQEIRKFLHERGLAAYKIPDRVEWINSFPQTALGKVSKKKLRQLIEEQLSH
ncbi:(2,3-dihydroxybenzoyl)adenylate synthase [Aquibacillus rhizosphaerae]|uniref:(2,3-dihydroxybenzoyl)adenylate synthase n=1 Tax=Aquibacillus rhizosphaerae TaxID=3051431 RepID=A0ABT7L3S6_9BACI|nr:(2,3-dihydroxybenzoyl)adenylate synthase [Aquibacillus sp. LR5S19]MDL4840526.1 (2,3-dihydroxybenzoyl)adenylate synthase [Aquibacillus sp. LR5S19]